MKIHPDAAEFERQMAKNPKDATTRLVYADWLKDKEGTEYEDGEYEEALRCRSFMSLWISPTPGLFVDFTKMPLRERIIAFRNLVRGIGNFILVKFPIPMTTPIIDRDHTNTIIAAMRYDSVPFIQPSAIIHNTVD